MILVITYYKIVLFSYSFKTFYKKFIFKRATKCFLDQTVEKRLTELERKKGDIINYDIKINGFSSPIIGEDIKPLHDLGNNYFIDNNLDVYRF